MQVKMIEEDLDELKAKMNKLDTDFTTLSYVLGRIEGKIDKLIPEVKDVSKHLAEAKELANKGKHPRKQPKKKLSEGEELVKDLG